MLGTLEPNRTERKPRSRGKGFIILVSLLLFLAAVIVGGGLYWRWATGATGPQTRVTVEIPQGATGSQVADILKQKDVIHSPLAFRLLAKFRGFSGGFKAGRYPLTTNMSVEAVLAALKKGPVRIPSIPVLLPEGWRITQIAPRVQQRLHIPAKTFLQVATSGRFSLPGYLPTGA